VKKLTSSGPLSPIEREMGATANLGNVALNRRDFDRAQQLFEQALELNLPFESLDDLGRFGPTSRSSRTRAGGSSKQRRTSGNQTGLMYGVLVLAANAAAAGDDERAAVLAGATASAAEAMSLPARAVRAGLHDRTVAQLRGRLGDERAEALFARGAELPFDEAVELAAGRRVDG
jgi:hypothetical protein